jgi:hypothetical protein
MKRPYDDTSTAIEEFDDKKKVEHDNSSTSEVNMMELTEETMCFHVFSCLPVHELLSLRRVCKLMNQYVTSDYTWAHQTVDLLQFRNSSPEPIFSSFHRFIRNNMRRDGTIIRMPNILSMHPDYLLLHFMFPYIKNLTMRFSTRLTGGFESLINSIPQIESLDITNAGFDLQENIAIYVTLSHLKSLKVVILEPAANAVIS